MPETYTVQAGDSLSSISKKFYGSFSMADTLATVNKIANKDLISPGQKLILPDVEEAEVIEEEDESTGSSKKKYLWWLLLAVAAAGGGYYLYKKNQQAKEDKAWRWLQKKPKLSGVKKKRKRK